MVDGWDQHPLFTMFGRYARDAADQAALIAAYREYQIANHDRLIRCYDDVVSAVAMLSKRGHWLANESPANPKRWPCAAWRTVGLAGSLDTAVVGCDSSTTTTSPIRSP